MAVNPLDGFEVSERTTASWELTFTNLGVEAGLAANCSYDATWFEFRNDTEALIPLAGTTSRSTTPRLSMPDARADFLMVRIRTTSPDHPAWASAVDVYLRLEGRPLLVGIDRAIDPGSN